MTAIYSTVTLDVKFLFLTIILCIPWISFIIYQQNCKKILKLYISALVFIVNTLRN
jgi:hypothetical protein